MQKHKNNQPWWVWVLAFIIAALLYSAIEADAAADPYVNRRPGYYQTSTATVEPATKTKRPTASPSPEITVTPLHNLNSPDFTATPTADQTKIIATTCAILVRCIYLPTPTWPIYYWDTETPTPTVTQTPTITPTPTVTSTPVAYPYP